MNKKVEEVQSIINNVKKQQKTIVKEMQTHQKQIMSILSNADFAAEIVPGINLDSLLEEEGGERDGDRQSTFSFEGITNTKL